MPEGLRETKRIGAMMRTPKLSDAASGGVSTGVGRRSTAEPSARRERLRAASGGGRVPGCVPPSRNREAMERLGIDVIRTDGGTQPRAALGYDTIFDYTDAVRDGVNFRQTVAAWREKLKASWEIPKMKTRTVTRGGTTYQQNTANIGKHNQEPPPAPKQGPPSARKPDPVAGSVPVPSPLDASARSDGGAPGGNTASFQRTTTWSSPLIACGRSQTT